ncbi:cytosine/adenosine deaminase-related metal-dependent hydrolase [Kibdelosporangium banguiense]|uniref:Cytosine/adenosine deaminase-related metal-dependent hydrolase n=1 Tax=Kibdelosporangium banguiense TaxID=1365924 RepID=A0ABS4TEX2_9PSEU|nr:8-oxoguanine deaminase [Kibdelosporangium banguiense]MBP2322967.1 cytosine/adenosine deaminase-related metal-dependent hydrolase [Kibdelosporangium banguiense]
MDTLITGAYVATIDGQGTEFADGYVAVVDGRIAAVGSGAAPAEYSGLRRVDGAGCLVTPGLVNTHHHLYQWGTRGYAQQEDLFGWLVALYPVWAGINAEIVSATSAAGLGMLALSGCTAAADHHYVFPRDGGDVFEALIDAGRRIGIRLHAIRGSMDRGESKGGLPPDSIVEETDEALAETERAIGKYHDSSAGAKIQVAVGPCSPFSASTELMREAAGLARRHGVRLHTHLAETQDEEEQCLREFGKTPVAYAEDLGWLGSDVWLAHGVHLHDDEIALMGRTGTGIAHCPSSNARLGSGMAPVRALLDVNAPVGLGVDGVASNESGGLAEELRQALFTARQRGGAKALTVRQALWVGTMGGARCLGRAADIGSIEPGKLADLAIWRVDTIAHAGIVDPVAALVLGRVPPLEMLLVGGEPVVGNDRLLTADEPTLARDLAKACQALRN